MDATDAMTFGQWAQANAAAVGWAIAVIEAGAIGAMALYIVRSTVPRYLFDRVADVGDELAAQTSSMAKLGAAMEQLTAVVRTVLEIRP